VEYVRSSSRSRSLVAIQSARPTRAAARTWSSSGSRQTQTTVAGSTTSVSASSSAITPLCAWPC